MQLYPASELRIAGGAVPYPVRQTQRRRLFATLPELPLGSFNLFIGIYLLSIYPVVIGPNPACFALAAGALAMGAYLSLHFGKVFRNTG